MVNCNGTDRFGVVIISESESSSCTLISSSDSSLGCGDGEFGYGRVSPSDAEAAKNAAADDGTNERNALFSPPINNGADAVANDVACWVGVVTDAVGVAGVVLW